MCGVMFGIHAQVATFILQKILLDDTGLAYICQTYERFSHVAMVLVSEWVDHSGAHVIAKVPLEKLYPLQLLQRCFSYYVVCCLCND